MQRTFSSTVVLLAALAVACTDATSPPAQELRQSPAVSALFGDPPPPPEDTAMAISSQQGQTTLRIGATYFLNPTEKAGFVHFSSDQEAGVSISPDAQISYHLGAISGQGVIQAPLGGGLITIDLATGVNSGVFNGSCDKVCASIPFTGTFASSDGGESVPTSGVLTVGHSTGIRE